MSGEVGLSPVVAFGRALRSARIASGLSQEALALDSGVQRNFISLIETGQNQPTLSTIFRLAAGLNLKASDLVRDAEERVVRGKVSSSGQQPIKLPNET